MTDEQLLEHRKYAARVAESIGVAHPEQYCEEHDRLITNWWCPDCDREAPNPIEVTCPSCGLVDVLYAEPTMPCQQCGRQLTESDG